MKLGEKWADILGAGQENTNLLKESLERLGRIENDDEQSDEMSEEPEEMETTEDDMMDAEMDMGEEMPDEMDAPEPEVSAGGNEALFKKITQALADVMGVDITVDDETQTDMMDAEMDMDAAEMDMDAAEMDMDAAEDDIDLDDDDLQNLQESFMKNYNEIMKKKKRKKRKK